MAWAGFRVRMRRAGHQYDWEMDRTCQESKTAKTVRASCNMDPKLWPGEKVILLLDKASKAEAFDLCYGRP